MRRIVWAVVLAVLLGLVFRTASGEPPAGANPDLAPWYQSLRDNSGVSCCSVADCRPADYRMGPKGYEVFVGDEWRHVPHDKVILRENPTGAGVVCWTPDRGVMCFVRGTEI